MDNHVPVHSSNLTSVAYDPDTRVLEVEFTGGARYQYAGVPATEHAALMAAGSKGAFLSSRIKNVYAATKVAKG